MKKIIGVIIGLVILIAIIAVLYFKFFKGIGTAGGTGDDNLPKFEQGTTEESTESREEETEPEEPATDEQEDKVPDNIIVEIIEDKVTINGEPVANSEELRDKIIEYNNDKRTFELRETKSILSTYEWVAKTFDELEIFLKEQ